MAIPFPPIAVHTNMPTSIPSTPTEAVPGCIESPLGNQSSGCKQSTLSFEDWAAGIETGISIPPPDIHDGSIDQDPTEWKPKISDGRITADQRPDGGFKGTTRPARERAAAAFLVQFDGVHPLMQRARDMDARKKRNSELRKGAGARGRKLRRYPFAVPASTSSETDPESCIDTDDEHGGHITDSSMPPGLSSSHSVASSVASSTDTLPISVSSVQDSPSVPTAPSDAPATTEPGTAPAMAMTTSTVSSATRNKDDDVVTVVGAASRTTPA
ncbi:hypothetical protein AAP_01081 [Ascosphaera apis ARSEF 7405]|uniref:Uncharacterized protein n=1 Tax=Ascosphaera apis ARSEF 7405 TaxID=392613 RepID=A0A168C996_9EURO|nr:hypothetical protein AAP_01081 [Ascosphaera apis ARSEF 7405]